MSAIVGIILLGIAMPLLGPGDGAPRPPPPTITPLGILFIAVAIASALSYAIYLLVRKRSWFVMLLGLVFTVEITGGTLVQAYNSCLQVINFPNGASSGIIYITIPYSLLDCNAFLNIASLIGYSLILLGLVLLPVAGYQLIRSRRKTQRTRVISR